MKKTALGALLWLFCLQYFLAEAIAIAGWRGVYSLSQNYISDLGAVHCDASGGFGAICSPLHGLMNASFELQGLLILGGAMLTAPLFPRGKLFLIALALIGASGFGVFFVGFAPEDYWPGLHYLAAAENLVCDNAGMAVLGAAMVVRSAPTRLPGALAFSAGALGLLGVILLGRGVYFGLGVGVIERIAAYPFPLAIAAVGALLYLRGGLVRATL